jgi:hypothetical protein
VQRRGVGFNVRCSMFDVDVGKTNALKRVLTLASCAGICELSKDPSTGKMTRIRLKMSTPLLQYRPRSDTINTLLHEAIHAYFFITTSWRHSRGDDGTGHGAGFQLLADAINNHGRYDITVFHTFQDEVDSYRTHIWQCDGPCRSTPPYFGLVKRSMNRAPGKTDTWWAAHQAECGGTYTKIAEPDLTKKQKDALSKKERAGLQKNKLDGWVKVNAQKIPAAKNDRSPPAVVSKAGGPSSSISSGKRKINAIVIDDVVENVTATGINPGAIQKKSKTGSGDDGNFPIVGIRTPVECPICAMQVADSDINQHLDVVHPP